MTQAGGDVKEEVWRAFIVLLTNAPELHSYAARSLFRALRDHLAHAELSLLATATWYIGACLSSTHSWLEVSSLVRHWVIRTGSGECAFICFNVGNQLAANCDVKEFA